MGKSSLKREEKQSFSSPFKQSLAFQQSWIEIFPISINQHSPFFFSREAKKKKSEEENYFY
jgi:hypothetical protein